MALPLRSGSGSLLSPRSTLVSPPVSFTIPASPSLSATRLKVTASPRRSANRSRKVTTDVSLYSRPGLYWFSVEFFSKFRCAGVKYLTEWGLKVFCKAETFVSDVSHSNSPSDIEKTCKVYNLNIKQRFFWKLCLCLHNLAACDTCTCRLFLTQLVDTVQECMNP